MKVISAICTAILVALASPALAQKWPDRTVKLVVPYPPGGNVDSAARVVAHELQALLGQPFIIENKAGAGGLIGGEAVARAEPDGYTLFFGANGPILFAPEMSGRQAYAWRRDFAPISTISLTSIVLQVHPSVQAKTLQEFFDLVKREPGKLSMASPGVGTTNHLLSELIQDKLGLSWVTVQYRGNAPATNDVIAGHIPFNLDQVSVALPYIKDNRTRALAVTGAKRSQWLPDVPTFRELGHAEIVGQTFPGLLAPAKTAPEIIAQLNAAIAKILQDPQVKAKFEAMGAEVAPMSPEEFRQYLEKEDAVWLPIIRKANIKTQ